MSLYRDMALLAVRQFLGDRADSLLRFMSDRFGDHGRRLDAALRQANERAWRCLEVALAGSSWWSSCTGLLSARDEKQLKAHIQGFLASLPADQLAGDGEAFRARARTELQAARRAGLVPGPDLSARELSDEVRTFARYSDPRQLIEMDRRSVEGMAEVLRREGFADLARYVSLRPGNGPPLLVQAVRFFFRRQVEGDAQLAAGLTTDRLEGFDAHLRDGLDGLNTALTRHGDRLTELLAGVAEVVNRTHDDVQKVRTTTDATLDVVRDTSEDLKKVEAQSRTQTQELQELKALVLRLLDQNGRPAGPPPVATEPPPKRSTAVRPPARLAPNVGVQPSSEWDEVRQLLNRVKKLTPEEQQRRPDLSTAVQKLAAASEALETTQRTYERLKHTTAPPLPVYPPEPPILDALPADLPTKPARGRLYSRLFDVDKAADTPPADEPPPQPVEPPKRRLYSPLFDAAVDPPKADDDAK